MTLELIPVKSHAIVLAINVMPHLLLPFAFFWTGNHIWVLVISYQNHKHEVSDLDGKGMQSQSHAPAHATLKTHVWYVARLKPMVCFPMYSRFNHFLHS